jgi:hypothetical protein
MPTNGRWVMVGSVQYLHCSPAPGQRRLTLEGRQFEWVEDMPRAERVTLPRKGSPAAIEQAFTRLTTDQRNHVLDLLWHNDHAIDVDPDAPTLVKVFVRLPMNERFPLLQRLNAIYQGADDYRAPRHR